MIQSAKGNKSTGVIIRSEKVSENEYHNVAISTNHGITTKELAVYVPNYVNWSEIGKIKMYPGIAYYQHPYIDLGVIFFITEKKMPEAELGFDEKIYIGSKITRVGCGLGASPRLEKGTITGLNEVLNNKEAKRTYRMGIYTLPGDSGGPVYHNYRIVGWTQSIRQTQNRNLPIGDIHYSFANAIRLKDLCSIARKENLKFLIDKKEPLPKFGFFKLKIDFLDQDSKIIPDNPWIGGNYETNLREKNAK